MSIATHAALRWQHNTAEAVKARDPHIVTLFDDARELMRAVPVGKTADEREAIIVGCLLQMRNDTIRQERESARNAANAAIEGIQRACEYAVRDVCKRRVTADFDVVVPEERT